MNDQTQTTQEETMSNDENTNQDNELEMAQLDALKGKADQLNVKYHPAIGYDKLAEKVAEQERLLNEQAKANKPELSEAQKAANEARLRKQQTQVRSRRSTRLIRVKVTNLNPDKREWQGEIITASNDFVEEKRFVPFKQETHVPEIIYNAMMERNMLAHREVKTPGGGTVKQHYQTKEFSIERLPQLTPEELEKLGKDQRNGAFD